MRGLHDLSLELRPPVIARAHRRIQSGEIRSSAGGIVAARLSPRCLCRPLEQETLSQAPGQYPLTGAGWPMGTNFRLEIRRAKPQRHQGVPPPGGTYQGKSATLPNIQSKKGANKDLTLGPYSSTYLKYSIHASPAPSSRLNALVDVDGRAERSNCSGHLRRQLRASIGSDGSSPVKIPCITRSIKSEKQTETLPGPASRIFHIAIA